MYESRLVRAAVLGTALWLMGASAQAAPLFDFGSASATTTPVRDTLGYAFTVSADVTVDGIGMFDFGSDGLGSAHEVALWNSSNTSTPLVSAILNAGTSTAGSDPSISSLGSYIYANIAALVLGPGSYVLGASFLPANANKDSVAVGVVGITSNSANAAFGEGRFGFSTGVNAEFPSFPAGSDRYFGPALRIAVATIPEPLTLTLLIIGMAGIGLGLRNSTSRRQPQLRVPDGTLPA